MRAQFITASEVAEIMGISRSKAYQIVREMNRELKSQGYLTVAGKCPAQYFIACPARAARWRKVPLSI